MENIQKKWRPVFESIDSNNIFTPKDLYSLSHLFEDFSLNINNFVSFDNNDIVRTDINILPLLLKVFYKLKSIHNINICYNKDNITEDTLCSIICIIKDLSFDNTSYIPNITEEIYIKLENIYKRYKSIFINSINIFMDINTNINIMCNYTTTNKKNINMKKEIKTDINKETLKNTTTNFQECSHLEIEDVFTDSKNTLADLYNLQKDIQENVYGYDFNALQSGPLPELRKFFDWNYHAIQDELRETFAALGGMSDGIGNGVWKPWKKAYTEQAPNMTYNDMSDRDKKELKMELIDIQHFLFNMMLGVGITPEELMNFYFAKNKENRLRQQRGY